MCEIEPKPLGALCKKISTEKSVQKNRHFFWFWANGQLSRNLLTADRVFIGKHVSAQNWSDPKTLFVFVNHKHM